MHRTRCITGLLACVLVVFVTGATNPQSTLTPKEQLGKLLFFDTNLSVPAGQSCASCHFPGTGYADPHRNQPVSWGATNWVCGSRNTPTVSYCAFTPEAGSTWVGSSATAGPPTSWSRPGGRCSIRWK